MLTLAFYRMIQGLQAVLLNTRALGAALFRICRRPTSHGSRARLLHEATPSHDLPRMQPFAGLLPSEVHAPGAPVAPITAAAADTTGLPGGCLICAGTTGGLPARPEQRQHTW